ncbi:MAG: hydroxyacylglutathione hydrolase [Pseudomonadota bacterium]
MSLEIHQFPILNDNYAVLIREPTSGAVATIDAGDGDAILAEAEAKGWAITHILTTHHHADHTAGNDVIKARTGCTVVGANADRARIPGLDVALSEGDTYDFGAVTFDVLETPGHTVGHISYVAPSVPVAFVGDTLFALGCGRLFEGDARMMWTSLSKLMALDPGTIIYCGHEYTAANAAFALTIDPDNEALRARAELIKALRAEGKATVPTTIEVEQATNPFVRPNDPQIRRNLGLEAADDWEVFAEVRRRKDAA